jgi:hypothetical protein
VSKAGYAWKTSIVYLNNYLGAIVLDVVRLRLVPASCLHSCPRLPHKGVVVFAAFSANKAARKVVVQCHFTVLLR